MSRVYEKKRWAEMNRETGEYVYKVKDGWKVGKRKPRKKVNKKGIPIVHGDRICRSCGGICHEGSYREDKKWKDRKSYYCSKSCMKRGYHDRLEKSMTKSAKKYRHSITSLMDSIEKTDHYKKYLKEWISDHERVDVITR